MVPPAEQRGAEGLGRSQGGAAAAERTERAEDELLISGGSSHLISAGALLASMAQEHVSRAMTPR